MSQANVEIVRRGLDVFASDGVEALAAFHFFAPDVVFRPFPEWVEQPEYVGEQGLRSLVGLWTENFDEFALEVADIREAGDEVVVLGEIAGRIKGSGVPIRQPVGVVYGGFRDGQISRGAHFLTWHEALEAVGLSE